MAMKLLQTDIENKIGTICDNDDYCIVFACLGLFGNFHFSQSFLKKINFQLRLTWRHR